MIDETLLDAIEKMDKEVEHVQGQFATVRMMLREVTGDLEKKGIAIRFTAEAEAFLLERGYDPKFGARPLRKTVQRHVEDEMAEQVLTGRVVPGDTVTVSVEGDRLSFGVTRPALLSTGEGA